MADIIEMWKPVVGHEDSYEVSDLGRVRSVDRWIEHSYGVGTSRRLYRGKMLKQLFKDNRGVSYFRVGLWAKGKARTAWVHTLVLETFIGPRLPGFECAHEDGNTRNNGLRNLSWKTSLGNYADRLRHGTQRLKVTPAQTRQIRAESQAGATYVSLSEKYSVCGSHIRRIVLGRRWKAPVQLELNWGNINAE